MIGDHPIGDHPIGCKKKLEIESGESFCLNQSLRSFGLQALLFIKRTMRAEVALAGSVECIKTICRLDMKSLK